MQDHNSSNGGARKSPPPFPAMPPTKGIKTASFRGGIPRSSRPPPAPGRIEGTKPIVNGPLPVPAVSRDTQSIAKHLPKAVVDAEKERERTLDDTLGLLLNAKGDTLIPAPPNPEDAGLVNELDEENPDAAAKLDDGLAKKLEEEERFLRYGSALYRVSELTGEDWKEWVSNPAVLREKVADAVEVLNELDSELDMGDPKREMYSSEYWMMGGLSREIADAARLANYIDWINAKEKEFPRMARAYGDMNVTPLTPYIEVMDACEKRLSAGALGDPNEAIILFNQLIVNPEEYANTVYSKGEMHKKMFDSWYMYKAAETMRSIYDVPAIASERDAVLFRVGELQKEMDGIKQENQRLREEAGKGAKPPAATEELRELRASNVINAAEIGDLQRAVLREQEATSGARAENSRLNEVIGDKNTEILTLRDALHRAEKDNAELIERAKALVAAYDRQNEHMRKMETRMALMENRMNTLEEDKKRLSRELAALKEPKAERGPTLLSEVPSLIAASGMGREEEAITVVGPREPLERARDSEQSTEEVTAVFQRGEPQVGAEDAEPYYEAIEEEPLEQIVDGDMFDEKVDRVLGVGAAPMALEAKPAEGRPGAAMPAEIKGKEAPAVEKGRFWDTYAGKAVNGIFVYGFSGKGELPSKPEPREIDWPSISEGEAYQRAVQEQKDEAMRVGMGMAEYNSWYNNAGRWIREKREGTISAANQVSEFYSRNKRRVRLAAAGAAAVGAIALFGVVAYNALETIRPSPSAIAEMEFSKPVPALVAPVNAPAVDSRLAKASAATRAEQVKVAKEAPKPKVPEYDLNAAISNALANNGLSAVDSVKGAGPQLRAMYNAALKIENPQGQFAVLAYLTNYMLDNGLQLKMEDGLVRNILIGAMGTARNFAMADPQANGAAVKIITRASGVLNKDGGFSDSKPTKGQEMLYKNVIEWMGTLPASALETQEVQEETAPRQEIGAAGAVVAGAQAPQALSAPAAAASFDFGKVAENAFARNGIPRDGHPRDIYRKARALENIEEEFAILAETADRVYGSKEIQHKMSESVLAQIIIDAMGASVEFASVPGQDLGKKKAALSALTRMNNYLGPKGEFDTRSPPAGYDKKVREAREGALMLGEEVGALETQAASLRGSPTAAEGNAPVLPPTVNGISALDNAHGEPAYSSNGVADWFIEQSFQVNGLKRDDPPRKILEASWKMNVEERFAVLSDLCERMRKDPGLIPEEEPELRIDVLLSAADAGKIVADMPRLFRGEGAKPGMISRGGELEMLIISQDYVEMAGTPGQDKKVWTPERAEKRRKLAQVIKNQIEHRGRQIKKAFIEDSNALADSGEEK